MDVEEGEFEYGDKEIFDQDKPHEQHLLGNIYYFYFYFEGTCADAISIAVIC